MSTVSPSLTRAVGNLPTTPKAISSISGTDRLSIKGLANIPDSPLKDSDARKHTPEVNCFSLRKAMQMHISRSELGGYTKEKLEGMNQKELDLFLDRAIKTMENTQNMPKMGHFVVLFDQMNSWSIPWKPDTKTTEGGAKENKFERKLSAMQAKLEDITQKGGDYKTRFHADGALGLFDGAHNHKLKLPQTPCFSVTNHLSTNDLKHLSISFLLDQSPDDLKRILARADITLEESSNGAKRIELESMLAQLYLFSTDLQLSAVAGNKSALLYLSYLEGILDKRVAVHKGNDPVNNTAV